MAAPVPRERPRQIYTSSASHPRRLLWPLMLLAGAIAAVVVVLMLLL